MGNRQRRLWARVRMWRLVSIKEAANVGLSTRVLEIRCGQRGGGGGPALGLLLFRATLGELHFEYVNFVNIIISVNRSLYFNYWEAYLKYR